MNPFTRVGDLQETAIAELVAIAQRLVKANILEDSADTRVTYGGLYRRTTRSVDPRERVWVYGRAGEECRKCGAKIQRRLQGPDARVTFWCPRCEPMADRSDIVG